MKNGIFISGLFLFALFVQEEALGEDSENQESIYVIQNRMFDRHHELGASLEYIPDDDFFNAYPVGANYIYHFNETYAWEVIRGQWVFSDEKDLKKDLVKEFGAEPSQFDKMEYVLHSSFIIKPTYGKDSFLNRGIINHETYLSLGGGVVQYEREYDFGDPTTEKALSLGLSVARKYFLSKQFSLNLELRDLIVFKEDDTVNNVFFGIGVSYRFDLSPRESRASQEADKIYRYLKDDNE